MSCALSYILVFESRREKFVSCFDRVKYREDEAAAKVLEAFLGVTIQSWIHNQFRSGKNAFKDEEDNLVNVLKFVGDLEVHSVEAQPERWFGKCDGHWIGEKVSIRTSNSLQHNQKCPVIATIDVKQPEADALIGISGICRGQSSACQFAVNDDALCLLARL
jgi:hypothetical protein